MTSEKPDLPEDDESTVDAALERGLLRQPLDAEAVARVRRAVEAEFQSQYGRRRRVPTWAVAMAAVLACITVLASLMWFLAEDGAPVGRVARIENGGLEARSSVFRQHDLKVGDAVPGGQRVASGGTSIIALAQGGTLRVAPGAVLRGTGPNDVELISGRVFLDFPADAGPFVLRTSAGSIEHVGTQFEVLVHEGDTRIRVREGSVRMRTRADAQVVEAGNEIMVTQAGTITRRSIPTYGPDWAWVEAIAPDFDIEDRELADFLNWVARETGRHVEFADDRAREIAGRTRLHGSVHGLAPLEALQRVLSTTSLRVEVQADVIRLSSQQ